ncbi:hypothetical protein ABND49_20420 [Paenibacillus larvae]
MNGEGRLTPSTGFPWIPRNHLEPAVLDSDHYSVGSVERLDEFLSKHKEHHEQWSAYWEYTLRLFKYVTNQGLHEFHLPEYGRAEQGIVTIETSVVARHILMLYDELMKKKEQDYPPPVTKICKPGRRGTAFFVVKGGTDKTIGLSHWTDEQ